MKNIAVVIPAYNEEKVIRAVLEKIASNTKANIIVVNDASADNTQQIINELALAFPHITLLNNKENKGQGYSISKGIKYSLDKFKNIDYVLTVDADGQHDLADILEIIKICEESNYKVIKGKREMNKIEYPSQRIFILIGHLIFSVLFLNFISDPTCGLRAYHKSVAKTLNFADRYDYLVEANRAYLDNKKTSKEVSIKAIYDQYTISKGLNFASSLKFTISVIKSRITTKLMHFNFK